VLVGRLMQAELVEDAGHVAFHGFEPSILQHMHDALSDQGLILADDHPNLRWRTHATKLALSAVIISPRVSPRPRRGYP